MTTITDQLSQQTRDRLRDVADYIDTYASRWQFNMSFYTSFHIDLKTYREKPDQNYCNTAGCIAGWAWVMNHQKLVDDEFATALQAHFEDPDPAPLTDSGWLYVRPARGDNPEREFATEWFGLTQDQADELFCCNPPLSSPEDGTIWDKYVEELDLWPACDGGCEDYGECEGGPEAHNVQLSDISKTEAVMMLRGLASGEFTFGVDS